MTKSITTIQDFKEEVEMELSNAEGGEENELMFKLEYKLSSVSTMEKTV